MDEPHLLAHREQDRRRRRPPRGRVSAHDRRAPRRRLAHQRGGAAHRGRRAAGVHPQIRREGLRSRQARQCRQPVRKDGGFPRTLRAFAHDDPHIGRHRQRQDHAPECPVLSHLPQRTPDHHRGCGGAAPPAAACGPPRDEAAEPRRAGRNPAARTREERAAYAPRSHHPRRGQRRGGVRHASGDEHGPRGIDGHHSRQHAARCDCAAFRK